MRNSRVRLRATAIPVGAEEEQLGKGNNTAFLTRHCSRHGTLAFLPFAFRVKCKGNYANKGRQARLRLNATLERGGPCPEEQLKRNGATRATFPWAFVPNNISAQ